ncbi:MAG: PAS domain-containing protein [Alphaproteobacteria bacterium]|nr:PAS domain-containing protein [Alphaproteobacteria bacterium]
MKQQGFVIEAARSQNYSRNATLAERTRQEKQASILMQSTSIGHLGLDLQGEIVFANASAANMTGLSEEQLVGQRFQDMIQDNRNLGAPFSGRLVLLRPDASHLTIECTIDPVIADGESIGSAVSFWPRRGDAVSEEILLQAFQGYAAVVESLDAAVLVTDLRNHETLFMNGAFRDMIENHDGMRCWHALIGEPEGTCAVFRNETLLTTERFPGNALIYEYQDPQTGRWYERRVRAILWVDDRLARLEIITDVTSRKRITAKPHARRVYRQQVGAVR